RKQTRPSGTLSHPSPTKKVGPRRSIPWYLISDVGHPTSLAETLVVCFCACAPSSRCASAIQNVRPLESTADMQPPPHPASPRLSALISQSFISPSNVASLNRTGG